MIIKNDKNKIVIILCSFLILYMVAKPSICIASAIAGAKLFFYKVFPSLFSFLVITNIIMHFEGVEFYSKLLGLVLCKPLRLPSQCGFVLIVSILCGYPLGAKYTCELYEKNIVDGKTAERLLNIASNASPLFVIGAVGTSMLGSTYLGYILLLANYLSCFIMGLILPGRPDMISVQRFVAPSGNHDFGSVIKESIDNSLKNSLSIGGFVIMFSVVNNIIKSSFVFNAALDKLHIFLGISKDVTGGLALGIIEMTNGCNILALENIDIYLKIMCIGFLLAFSGLSIILQAYSFMYKFKFSLKSYVLRKMIQGIFGAVLSIILYKYIPLCMSIAAFNYESNSIGGMYFILILILIIPLLIHHLTKLFDTP